MNIQLDLLRERLREARQQYSSFVAMASSATKTGDKGLYQFATEGVHKYGDEVRTLIPQIRGLQNAIQQMGDVIAPQGHTIQNYVNSLQKANPELAQLNEQFKKGQSELQNQSTSYSNATQSAHQYTEEIRKQAQAIRESQQWKEKGYAMIGDRVYYDPERSVAPAKNRLSLEEQILNVQKEEEVAAIRAANAQRQEAAEKAATEQEARKVLATEQQITAEQQKRS
jgi:peptidoglycan hydrolase CwlO-like protein